mgnify:FL=1
MIIIVTIGTFCQNDIIYWYTHTFNESKYQGVTSNEYFLEDNFSYVNNYTDNDVSNKKQMIDLIYYFINSGSDKIEAYCVKEYTDCIKDLESISADQEALSIFNNFVHPYNSFSKLSFSYDEYGNFTITNNKIYDDKMISEINKIVDDYIAKNISSSLKDSEKLKLIHDFIIDNTKYDKLKVDNIEDETYNSENAYGVLIEHYGICSGYADTMAIFLNKLGIINYKISNDEHIWNLAYVDNKWVHIDLTWDDPVTENDINRTDYFMIDTKTLHELDQEHDFNTYIFEEAK